MRAYIGRIAAALGVTALVIGCGGGDEGGGPDCDPIAAALVERIEVTPATATVDLGDSLQLSARAFSCDGPMTGLPPFEWASANDGAVTVSPTGMVRAVTSAASVRVTASVQGKSGGATITSRPTPVATVRVEPATASIGVGRTSTLAARAFDEDGNELTGRAVQWSTANAAIVSVTQQGQITGQAVGGPVTVTATIEGQSGSSAVTVVRNPVGSVAVAPTSRALGGGETGQFTATVRDDLGNVLTDRAVSWTSSNEQVATVDPSGATVTVRARAPGSATITATSEGRSASAEVTVTVGQPARLAFVQQPTTVASGASIAPAVTVEVQDAAGNRVTSATTAITIALGNNPAGGTLGGTRTVNAVNGVATFGNLTLDRAGTGYTLTASATGLTGATSSGFNVTAGAAARLVFVQGPSNVVAGATMTPPVTVQVQDAQGNVVTGAGNVTLSVTGSPAGVTLGGTTTQSAASGTATFANLTVNRAGTYTLTASAGGLAPATSGNFTVSPSAATRLGVVTAPCTGGCTAGAPLAPAPQFEVLDASGNRVTGSTASVTVALSGGPGNAALSGTLTRNAVAGLVTFNDLSINRAGSGYVLTASSSGLTGAATAAFAVTSGSGSRLQVTSTVPATVTVGVALPSVTVQLLDAQSNPVAQAGVSVSLSLVPPSGATGSLGGTTTQPTNASGIATFTGVTVNATAASGYTLLASATGFTGDNSNAFAVQAGAIASLAFLQQPTTAAAGATIAPPVTVEARDAGGNRATGFTGQVSVALTSAGGATLGGTTAANAVAGVATFSNLTVSQAGTYSLTATYTTLSTQSASFTVNPPPSFTLNVARNGTGSGTVTSNPAGINCGADCAQAYPSGTVVTLTASPAGGSTFGSWSGCTTTSGTTCTVNVTGATTVTATFNAVPNFTVTVTETGTGSGSVGSSPTGISCPADCTEAFPQGTAVTLTASPAAGSTFAGWAGCPSPSGATCTIANLQANASVQATFTLQQFGLTVTDAGSGSGTVTSNPAGISCGADCTENYGFNTAVTLTESPSGGSYFGGWSGACTGTATTCQVTMTAARSVTATFVLLPNITTASLPGGQAGQPYSQALAATGGAAPLTWTVSAGSLPAGLTLDGATGTIAGTPTTAGLATFTVQVEDANGRTDTQALSIDVALAGQTGSAQALAFLVQPTNVDQGATITPAVQVQVVDAGGSRVTAGSYLVQLSLGTNPGGGTLLGTTQRSSVNGIATFNDLRITNDATGYRLLAQADGLQPATSNAFRVR